MVGQAVRLHVDVDIAIAFSARDTEHAVPAAGLIRLGSLRRVGAGLHASARDGFVVDARVGHVNWTCYTRVVKLVCNSLTVR